MTTEFIEQVQFRFLEIGFGYRVCYCRVENLNFANYDIGLFGCGFGCGGGVSFKKFHCVTVLSFQLFSFGFGLLAFSFGLALSGSLSALVSKLPLCLGFLGSECKPVFDNCL